MRKRTLVGRMAATGLAVSVAALGTTASAGSAAASNGVGTGTVSTSVIDAALGNLLGVSLLQDVASSTTDPKSGPAGASSVFRQLKLTSLVPALNQVVGEHRVSAPQGTANVTTSALDLSSLNLGAVINGTIAPLVLKALTTPNLGTTSNAKITNVGLLGGLANLGVLTALDSTGSGTASADAGRSMNLDALSLLDLGKLLQGLGLDILNLPLSVVSGLVTSLGIPLDLKGATSLQGLVGSLTGSIQTLTSTVESTVTAPLLQTIGGLGLPVPLRPVLDSAVGTALSTLQATLTALLNTVTSLLQSATLLKVNALDINTVAKAADTVAASTATASGRLGSLQVGPLALPGIDLAATTAALNNLLAQVQAALGGILAPLGLSNLLSLKLFDRQAGVSQDNGVVKAVSSITGLVVKLTPPSLGALSQLNHPADGLGSLIPSPTTSGRVAASVSAAAAAPAVAAAVPNPVEGLLGSALNGASLLSRGLELRVGTVQSQSLHSIPGSPVVPASPASPVPATATGATPTGPLPRTGGEQTRLAFLAMGLGAAALGARRLRRSLRS